MNSFHRVVGRLYTGPMEKNESTRLPACAPVGVEPDLEALVGAIAQQNEAAFAEFYDATSARAYGLILRITGSTPAAEEVMSDVYLQVWQQAQRFDLNRGNAMAWLYTLCRSRALDQLRRRDLAETHEDPESLRNEFSSEGDPLDLLVALDERNAIHAVVAELGDTERQLLALAFFRGLSHQEIADYTSMPLGSIKTLLRNAMYSLKNRLCQFVPARGSLS